MRSLYTHLSIAAGTLAVAGIAVGVAWHLKERVLPPTPADLLSEQRTLALFHVKTAEDMAHFNTWFPFVPNPPQITEESWVAIQPVSASQNGWVMFRTSPQGSAEPYVITTSSTMLQPTADGVADPLSSSYVFHDLRPDTKDSWAYLAPSTTPRTMIDGWLETRSALSMTLANDHISLTLPHDAHAEGISNNPQSPFADQLLSFTAGDWQAVLNALSKHLGQDPLLLSQALLQQITQPLWGNELSVQHDLLPLLQQQGTLSMTASGTQLNVVLEGTTDSTDDTEQTMETLRSAFRIAAPAVRREQRALGEQFSMDWLQADTSTLTEKKERVGKWELLIQSRSTGPALITAISGSRFLIANDEHMARRAAEEGSSLPAGTSFENTPSAAGNIDLGALQVLLAQMFPEAPVKVPFADIFKTGHHSWALESGSQTMTLELRTAK